MGDCISTRSSGSVITSAAGCIKVQWNGALTDSSMARRAPCVLARAMARSTALRWPDTTTWPGALSLAGWQISPAEASRATIAAVS